MKRSQYAKIGIFVVASVFLAIVACIWVSAQAMQRNKGSSFETYIEGPVQGISVGSPVKFRGIPVGTVESVGFAWSNYKLPNTALGQRCGRYARIVFNVKDLPPEDVNPEDVKAQVESGLRILIKSQGITGIAYLDIDYIKNADAPLPYSWEPKYPMIPSSGGLSKTIMDALEKFMADAGKISEAAEKAGLFVEHADALLGDMRLTLLSLLESFDDSARHLSTLLDKLSNDPSLILNPPGEEKEPPRRSFNLFGK